MDQRRNHKGNQKILRDEWKWKQNIPRHRDTAKALLSGKSTAINAYTKKEERSQNNNLTSQLKKLEKEQTKPKASRRNEIINIRMEINEIENRKTIVKINDTKSLFFQKINKINKILARWTKKKEIRLKLLKSETKVGHYYWFYRNEKDYESTTNNCTPIHWIT